MAFVLNNLIKETSATTGTGTFDLNGAETGYRTFVTGIGDSNTSYYVATDGTDFEIGVGTVAAAAVDTLSRDTILDSSNSGSKVNWGEGSKTIYNAIPAERTAYFNSDGKLVVASGQTFDVSAGSFLFPTDAAAEADTLETTLTDDDTHIPTSGAVVDAFSDETNADNVGAAMSTTGQVASQPVGSPVQTVYGTAITSLFSTTQTTYQDTGINATITPKYADSKLEIEVVAPRGFRADAQESSAGADSQAILITRVYDVTNSTEILENYLISNTGAADSRGKFQVRSSASATFTGISAASTSARQYRFDVKWGGEGTAADAGVFSSAAMPARMIIREIKQ